MRQFVIEIHAPAMEQEKISEIMGLENTFMGKKEAGIWIHEFDHEPDTMETIYTILNTKFRQLNMLGITKEEITLWYFVESNNKQINMEFSPTELELISKLGLSLCISAWDKNSTISMDDLTS